MYVHTIFMVHCNLKNASKYMHVYVQYNLMMKNLV